MRLCDLSDVPGSGFGGKAEGLARLVRAGVSVPTGFALSATSSPPSAWPDGVRDAFLHRLRDLLADGPVSVRSSALGEDGGEASFAGLFQTVLGVADEAAALEAAEVCIRSGRAERVRVYAGRTDPVPVGLVVQRMVEARAAGVVFSREPEGRDPGAVVEAVAGVGEGLVSGRVAPARWRVWRTGLGTLDTRGGPGVLAQAQVEEIARVAWDLAAAWQADLDLEWALDQDDRLWWLQARPITTGSPWRPPAVLRSARGADDGPISVWSNFNVRESMPDPLHPLSWSVWKSTLVAPIMRAMTGIPETSPVFERASGIDLVNGRVSFNLNAFLASPLLGPFMLRALHHLDAPTADALRDLARRGVLRPRHPPGARTAMILGFLSEPFRGTKLPGRFRPKAWLEALAATASRLRQRPPVQGLTDAELVAELRILSLPECAVLRAGMEAANMSFYVWALATWLFRPWPDAARVLATGVQGNPTTDISLALDDLIVGARPFADRLQAPDALPALRQADDPGIRRWLQAFDAFLDTFGHRVPREFDLATPRWSDDPAPVLDLVRTGLSQAGGESLRARVARLATEREALVQAALREAPAWRRPWMRWLARVLPAWMPLREAPKHHVMQGFLRVRHAAVELGRRLAERNVLADANDVFFLEMEELEQVLSTGGPVRDLIDQRREDMHRWLRETPPDILRSDGVPVAEGRSPSSDSLGGLGIGGGVAEGTVVRLDAPDPWKVHAGDVLVVAFADPCWTPLFPRVSALVMEVGGTMCHAAVVARELGIPAVFGVRNARDILRDGERVRVDGDRGCITRLDQAGAP